ncbi:hypothetical protein C0389_05835 [bacterium]|nr:hypothetical protein [bacterium]
MIKWRKWVRILHRDIGYIVAGLTVIYSISGIAVNHLNDWNPNYDIDKSVSKISPIPEKIINSDKLIPHILGELKESGKLRNSFFADSTTLNIFVEGNNIVVNLKSGEVLQEKITSRVLIRQSNYLHLNTPKRIWTFVADIFAVALTFLAISGLFMIKGKKGITGRGAWLTAIGVLIPIIFYLIYF